MATAVDKTNRCTRVRPLSASCTLACRGFTPMRMSFCLGLSSTSSDLASCGDGSPQAFFDASSGTRVFGVNTYLTDSAWVRFRVLALCDLSAIAVGNQFTLAAPRGYHCGLLCTLLRSQPSYTTAGSATAVNLAAVLGELTPLLLLWVVQIFPLRHPVKPPGNCNEHGSQSVGLLVATMLFPSDNPPPDRKIAILPLVLGCDLVPVSHLPSQRSRVACGQARPMPLGRALLCCVHVVRVAGRGRRGRKEAISHRTCTL